jgi:membrane associated rhomboid family serine protease
MQTKRPLLGSATNSLVLLVSINALIFIALKFIWIVYYFNHPGKPALANSLFDTEILHWFTIDSQSSVFLHRPWTLLTYMVSHYSVFALIANMLWLWAYGFILQDLTGNGKLIPLYLYGGIIGMIVFLAAANFIPAFAIVGSTTLLGAGPAVMAVAVATTTLAPQYRVFRMINGGIPLWVITLIFVLINFATIGSSGGSIALAHLAAAAIGFVFMKQLQRGKDWSKWMVNLAEGIDNLFNPEKKASSENTRDQLFYKAGVKPYTKKAGVTQQRIDRLLDKINETGYDSLSQEEKDFLTKVGQ